ncbi:MAG TPA: hypothetical protein VIC26_03700 [Marinagarivorans sp.]
MLLMLAVMLDATELMLEALLLITTATLLLLCNELLVGARLLLAGVLLATKLLLATLLLNGAMLLVEAALLITAAALLDEARLLVLGEPLLSPPPPLPQAANARLTQKTTGAFNKTLVLKRGGMFIIASSAKSGFAISNI